MGRQAKDTHLVLHIGLHKTATTYLQNVLSARRYDLIQQGLLYPSTGTYGDVPMRTREGAQSGHALFTSRQPRRGLLPALLNEIPPHATTVLLSSEDFTRPGLTPEHYAELLGRFASVRVVLVLRRQDVWIESLYKQEVDQYTRFETRAFGAFLADEGPSLMDFHTRFSPWREFVGPENFEVLSYDDLADGTAITRRVLEFAGADVAALGEFPGVHVPRYESVRAIDTIGLRILNSYRLASRDVRDALAREIYTLSPAGGLRLMTPQMRQGIQERCAEVNARIEEEWFTEPVPGFRFGAEIVETGGPTPSAAELVAYVDQVMALCESARRDERAAAAAAAEVEVALGGAPGPAAAAGARPKAGVAPR